MVSQILSSINTECNSCRLNRSWPKHHGHWPLASASNNIFLFSPKIKYSMHSINARSQPCVISFRWLLSLNINVNTRFFRMGKTELICILQYKGLFTFVFFTRVMVSSLFISISHIFIVSITSLMLCFGATIWLDQNKVQRNQWSRNVSCIRRGISTKKTNTFTSVDKFTGMACVLANRWTIGYSLFVKHLQFLG